MIYARVENGIVTNTVRSDPGFAARAGLIEMPNGFEIGDRYDSAQRKFTKAPPVPPPVVLELTKGQLTARLLQMENELNALKAQVAAL